ncbi:hypothetical protein [Frankia sp. AgB32]|uniref:hypothetical protein n=1 Tax=Frankia sp. AgB32 TaxID=631119 RepID=UPI00200BC139|nr:hypothetical protein [Frankia sp. AgB32]MCK9896531.1 hypothetical protein [Frankia sp. AgB32]
MTELDGGGHEERPGSGIPAHGTPNPAAQPPDPGAPGIDPGGAPGGSIPGGTAGPATGPGTAGLDLRGRHVLYDGWTPPSDDPLFGGPRSYAFSFDHLRPDAAAPDPAVPTGQHRAAPLPAMGQAALGSGEGTHPGAERPALGGPAPGEAWPGRHARPASRPASPPRAPGSPAHLGRPGSAPVARDGAGRPETHGAFDPASAQQPAAAEPPRSGWAVRGWPAPTGKTTGATPVSWQHSAGATGPLPSPAGRSRTDTPLTGGQFGADRPDPRYPAVRPGERARLDDAYDDAPDDAPDDDEAHRYDDADEEEDGARDNAGLAEDRWAGGAGAGVDRARRPRRMLVVVAGAVLLLVAAVAAVTLRGGGDQGGSPSTSAAPSLAPIPKNFLDSTATDSDKITANEFFPDSPVQVDDRGYRRLARRLDTGCPQLTGDLTKQFAAPHCGQVVRALFLGTPPAGTRAVLVGVTVFSLDTATTAAAGAQTLNQGRGGIAPLSLPAGAIQNAQITGPGGNNSWRSALSRGHYLIYTQVAYVDGTAGAGTDPPLRSAQTDIGILAAEPLGDRAVLGHGPRR